MQTQTYRTTFEFDRETMATLRQLAFEARLSMTKVVRQAVADYSRKKQAKPQTNLGQLGADLALFDKIAQSGIRIDAVQAVREERNRDNA